MLACRFAHVAKTTTRVTRVTARDVHRSYVSWYFTVKTERLHFNRINTYEYVDFLFKNSERQGGNARVDRRKLLRRRFQKSSFLIFRCLRSARTGFETHVFKCRAYTGRVLKSYWFSVVDVVVWVSEECFVFRTSWFYVRIGRTGSSTRCAHSECFFTGRPGRDNS